LWRSYKPAQATPRKRIYPNRGLQPAKSIHREGNYRDSTIYNWRQYLIEDEEARPLDEYEAYLHEKLLALPEDHTQTSIMLLDYWRGKEKTWPTLTRLALDSLSIPAMSAECERCFSSGKNMISDSRYSLAPDTIEACECNRHWIMHKTVP